ncbi:MAG: anion permease, partial [Halobacteriales archaeon]
TFGPVPLFVSGSGFALPIAMPPNDIVFGTGYLERDHMLRAGVLLDAVVVLLTTAVAFLLVRTVWPVVLG